MRFALLALASLAASSSAACSVSSIEPPPPEDEPMLVPPPTPEPIAEPRQPFKSPDEAPPPAVDPDTFAEVVYVLMRDQDFGLWFCTGTLVAPDKVVTAAHCLDPEVFVRYQIVAPLAPGKPRVEAEDPKTFGGHYDLVENPDIGFLTLKTPIDLPSYATLTNVTDRVEAGEPLTVAALVRTQEKPEAPLAMSAHMPLTSTVKYGYLHGFGTPYFSNGGDSGAGLFLVENGKPTHALVGVARQPEPDRDLDHFTRIDGAFLDWYAANAN